MKSRIVRYVAAATFSLSVVSWIWRFVDDHVRWNEIAFYVLVPLIAWLLFFGPLVMLVNERKWVRITAMLFLVPTALIWAISVLIGFFGLRIH